MLLDQVNVFSCYFMTFINLSELHKLFDLFVVGGAVLSIVLTYEVLKGRQMDIKFVFS